MWIRDALPADLPDLVHAMTAQDAREIYALRDNLDPFALIGDLTLALPHALLVQVAGLDGEPSAIAFLAIWPKGNCRALGDAALFATGRFRRIARPLAAHIREIAIPAMISRGLRRVEARCMAPHVTAQAFLRRCGATFETTLPDFGPDGLDYQLFAWRLRDVPEHAQDPADRGD